MTKKKVLLIGIDPKLIDFSKVTTANITINTAGWCCQCWWGWLPLYQLRRKTWNLRSSWCLQCIQEQHPRVSFGSRDDPLYRSCCRRCRSLLRRCCHPTIYSIHPFLSPIFLKESTKKDRYRSGFGGIQDRFDLIIPPSKIGNTSMGSIGLVYPYRY